MIHETPTEARPSSNIRTCEIFEGDKLCNVYRQDRAAREGDGVVITAAHSTVSLPVRTVSNQDIAF